MNDRIERDNAAPRRRAFLTRVAAVGVGTVALAGTRGVSAEGRRRGPQQQSYVMASSTEGKCGTCVFRGGERHVSRDMSEIHATTLGTCNNPKSPNYHRVTTPESGPMSAWVKWPAIDA